MSRHPLGLRILETVGSLIAIAFLLFLAPALLLLLVAVALMVHTIK